MASFPQYDNGEYKKTSDFTASIEGKERKYYETPDFPGRPWRVHDLTKQTTASERPNSFFTIVNPEEYKASGLPEKTFTTNGAFAFQYVYFFMRSFNGKTVYFEVYVRGTVHYDTPTLTESFIRDTLKLTDEDLEKYEGEDILTKFRGYVRDELMNGYNNGTNQISGYTSIYESQLNDLIWERLNEITKIIRIPKRAIQPVYESYLDSMVADYEYYKDTYGYSSLEQYFMDATGTKTIQEADEAMWYLAANAVKEQMVIFLIAKQEGLMTDEATLKAEADELFKNVVQSYIDYYYADTFAKYNDEEYAKAYNELATNLRAQYTEELLMENAVYERVFEFLRTCPNVTLVGRGQ